MEKKIEIEKNIFTKENYSFLCKNPDPEKKDKKTYLHVPKITLPFCENLHREIEIQPINNFFKKKKALFHQIRISNRQLDCILEEIGEKEVKKKAEPGVILNMSRKKILDIIYIYTTMSEFNKKNPKNTLEDDEKINRSNDKKKYLENGQKIIKNQENIAKKLENEDNKETNSITYQSNKKERKRIQAEMQMLRENNQKLVNMISNNQKKIYGKEKYNQEKAKILFEKKSFFFDLFSQVEKTKNNNVIMKKSNIKENIDKISKKRSVSQHSINTLRYKSNELKKTSKNLKIMKKASFSEYNKNQQIDKFNDNLKSNESIKNIEKPLFSQNHDNETNDCLIKIENDNNILAIPNKNYFSPSDKQIKTHQIRNNNKKIPKQLSFSLYNHIETNKKMEDLKANNHMDHSNIKLTDDKIEGSNNSQNINETNHKGNNSPHINRNEPNDKIGFSINYQINTKQTNDNINCFNDSPKLKQKNVKSKKSISLHESNELTKHISQFEKPKIQICKFPIKRSFSQNISQKAKSFFHEINDLTQDITHIKINEKNENFDFNDIPKNYNNYKISDKFHKQSVWNSILLKKDKDLEKIKTSTPPKIEKKKKNFFFSGQKNHPNPSNDKLIKHREGADLEEIYRIRKNLNFEKKENAQMKKFIRRKQRNYTLSLNKINKKILCFA